MRPRKVLGGGVLDALCDLKVGSILLLQLPPLLSQQSVASSSALSKLKSSKDTSLKVVRRGNKRSSDGPFTLHFAATHGELDRLSVLLSRPAVRLNVDSRDPDTGWTALHFAARGGHSEFADRLIGCGADVNALGPEGETPLHLAAGWAQCHPRCRC